MSEGLARWFAYIAVCGDGSFYVGHTQDLVERLGLHNSGEGAQWTALRRPVTLAYWEPFACEREAVRREAQWKRWSRAKKQALIGGDLERLVDLSRRHLPVEPETAN